MNILMVTNTFTPFVGGVARSVESFTVAYRRQGHRVMVVAPVYRDMPRLETDVVRLPAIQNFNGGDFSLRLPIPGFLFAALEDFRPDVVHSHHPYLLGDTALRIAAFRNVPLVFTHHTMYEQFTHYVPGDSPALRRFVIELSTGYANLCDCVIAPSDSVAGILRLRGVDSPIEVVPSGVDAARFSRGDGASFRASAGIPPDAFVVGHVGRLALEKNLDFLSRVVADVVRTNRRAWFLVIGSGAAEGVIREAFDRNRAAGRLVMAGVLAGDRLIDAYHAMDVFAFASLHETQGLVVTEAMAAGVPVVCVDAAGVREVVRNGDNGYLLPPGDAAGFRISLACVLAAAPAERGRMKATALETAGLFDTAVCAGKALALYDSLRAVKRAARRKRRSSRWTNALRLIEMEWDLWANRAHAAGAALAASDAGGRRRRG